MAVPHALPAQPIAVRPLGARLADERTVALFKSRHLEVMRIVLLQGKSFPSHQVAGDITIQCIEGRIDVTTVEGSHVLGAGELLYLPGGVQHGVLALADASALVTIALVP